MGSVRQLSGAASRHVAGGTFIAHAVSRDLDVTLLNMTRQRHGKTRASADLVNAGEELMAKLGKIDVRKSGRVQHTDATALPLARAVLLALANRNPKEARLIAELFSSPEELQRATERLLRRAFALDRVVPLET
ncbi:MAG: hypothetical protein HZA93_12855 [Verrucomicrobia bacterium]|nr:hypothetical protein [Verrucomicrobiota bacterium]